MRNIAKLVGVYSGQPSLKAFGQAANANAYLYGWNRTIKSPVVTQKAGKIVVVFPRASIVKWKGLVCCPRTSLALKPARCLSPKSGKCDYRWTGKLKVYSKRWAFVCTLACLTGKTLALLVNFGAVLRETTIGLDGNILYFSWNPITCNYCKRKSWWDSLSFERANWKCLRVDCARFRRLQSESRVHFVRYSIKLGRIFYTSRLCITTFTSDV